MTSESLDPELAARVTAHGDRPGAGYEATYNNPLGDAIGVTGTLTVDNDRSSTSATPRIRS